MTDHTKEPEVVAWISEVQCIGPGYGAKLYDAIPIQSLQPGVYKHIPLVRKSDYDALKAKCAELEDEVLRAIQGRVSDVTEERDRIRELEAEARKVDADNIRAMQGLIERNKELEGQLATASDALVKANELHFGPRMRRMEVLESQVRELLDARNHFGARCQSIGRLERQVHEASTLLRELEPNLDSLICYASTIREHPLNAMPKRVARFLAAAQCAPDEKPMLVTFDITVAMVKALRDVVGCSLTDAKAALVAVRDVMSPPIPPVEGDVLPTMFKALRNAPAVPVFTPTHRHIKTGGLYAETETGVLQTVSPVGDGAALVRYVNREGEAFYRPVDEFDSRFQKLRGES